MTTQFTPWTWTWSETLEGELILEHAPTNTVVARFAPGSWPTKANARLIAAAPEMRATLKEIIDSVDACRGHAFCHHDTSRARALLARIDQEWRRPSTRRNREEEASMKPPYPYTMTGHCAGCGANDVELIRVYRPDVFRYRCVTCLPGESSLPPREEE